MAIEEGMTEAGGVVNRRDLVGRYGRAAVDRALRDGTIVPLARGRYALPGADAALSAAHALAGTVSHASAALHWGWAVKRPPTLPDVTLPRNRKLGPVAGVRIHRAALHPDDVREGVTSRARTLLDCCRTLPFDEALAIADSALRDGFGHRALAALARDARGPGSLQARVVAAKATHLAANPFESVLRAIALDVDGLHVKPQVPLFSGEFLGRPDLVDVEARIVLEADSFEWHGGRKELARDARRYNAMVAAGWTVLRFCWEDVMHHPADVAEVLTAVVHRRTNQPFQ